MKKILLLIAILCTVSAYSTRYLVDNGSGLTWTDPTASGGTRVDLATAGAGSTPATFQAWYLGKTFSIGDEVWVTGGTYLVTAITTIKDGVSIYGGFYGNETATSGRPKSSSLAWDFTNKTILDGGHTVDLAAAGGFGAITANTSVNFTTLTYIDGFEITRFYRSYATTGNGGAVVLNANVTMQNCIISGNKLFVGTGNTNSGAGAFISGANCKLLNSYVYNNQAVKIGGVNANAGGILMMGDATVTGCTIESNTAAGNGGGMYMSYNNTFFGGGTVQDCIFKSNSSTTSGGGLGMNVTTANVLTTTIKNCQFNENSCAGSGGGAYLTASTGGTLVLESCSFVGNTTSSTGATNNAGLFIGTTWGTVSPIKNCVFRDNKNAYLASPVAEGAAFYISKATTLENCVIANNTGLSIGYSTAAGTIVNNCTFARNSGIALKFAGVASCSAQNNIFWNNSNNAITGGTTPTLDYNAYNGVTGVDAGVNSISTLVDSPNNTFVTPTTFTGVPSTSDGGVEKAASAAANWSLMAGCPAIDKGIDLSIATDILGNIRPTGANIVDMGAYESANGATSVSELKSDIQLFAVNQGIAIQGLTLGQKITVYSISGKIYANQVVKSSNEFIALAKGIYFVRIEGETYKVIVK